MADSVSMTAEFKNQLFELITQANEIQSRKLTEEIKNDIIITLEGFSKKIDETIEQNLLLQKKCASLERKIRKNNIIIFGLVPQKETLLSDTLGSLNQFLELTLSKSDINNIYTIGNSDKPPIVIEFLSFLTKSEIFKNIQKLRGTGVSITNDLSVEDRKEQKILYSHLKTARQQNLQAKISGNRLIIDSNPYTAEQLQHLEAISEINSTEQSSDTVETPQSKLSNPSLEKNFVSTHKDNRTNTQKNLNSPQSKKRKIIYSPKEFQTDGGKGVLTRSTTKKL